MAGRNDGWRTPMGRQYALELQIGEEGALRARAVAAGERDLFEAAYSKHAGDPVPAFLHSALCAMSLPTRRPKGDNEFKPIIRQDRSYSLAVTPKPRLQKQPDGKVELVNLGVPFGAYPRVILITIFSQAVRNQQREVFLGGNFRDMMRRFGYTKASRGGDRSQTNKLVEQLDRLLACEWMIHWEDENVDTKETAFRVNEVKLTHEYAGLNRPDGSFNRELRLSDVFYEHLCEHAVRFDMSAIYALRSKPTAIDLYTYLAFRLPRIPQNKPVELSYQQMAAHLGNSVESLPKLRQTIRRTLDVVSGVYPQARIDIGDETVKLHNSPKAIDDEPRIVSAGIPKGGNQLTDQRKGRAAGNQPGLKLVEGKPIKFPKKGLRYAEGGEPFLEIARRVNNGADIDMIADGYRSFMASQNEDLDSFSGVKLLKSWEGFCRKYKPRR